MSLLVDVSLLHLRLKYLFCIHSIRITLSQKKTCDSISLLSPYIVTILVFAFFLCFACTISRRKLKSEYDKNKKAEEKSNVTQCKHKRLRT